MWIACSHAPRHLCVLFPMEKNAIWLVLISRNFLGHFCGRFGLGFVPHRGQNHIREMAPVLVPRRGCAHDNKIIVINTIIVITVIFIMTTIVTIIVTIIVIIIIIIITIIIIVIITIVDVIMIVVITIIVIMIVVVMIII